MKFYRLSDATFYGRGNTIYQFIKLFLDKKCLFLRNMEPLIPYYIYSNTEQVPLVTWSLHRRDRMGNSVGPV